MEVCGWGTVGWASREIAGDTAAHTASTKASAFCNRNPPQTLSSQTPDPPPVCLFFFRSVAHGAEKIVFITCQHLAALSYATQDSIKLSYTGMKLQNRPGTPQQNYFIPPPKKKDGGCVVVRWGGDRWEVGVTDGEAAGERCGKWCDREKTPRGHFGKLSFTLNVW